MDGKATSDRYKNWFDHYVAPKYNGVLDGNTCYLFRCAMLHQGRMQHPASLYSRIFFVDPGLTGLILHRNVASTPTGTALNIDVRIFCEDVVSAAETWLLQARQLPQVAANLAMSVTHYPNGLPPFINRIPVIA
jgi:hypothetical protein